MNEKVWSIVKGGLLAAAGAGAAVLIEHLGELGLGPWAAVLGAAISVGINALRKAVEPASPSAPTTSPEEGNY